MGKGADTLTEFRRNQKVKLLDALPGVPQGTEGRVELVEGFTWTRYRVIFENGVDIGSIDGSKLARPKRYLATLEERERAAQTAVESASTNGDSEETAEAAVGDSKVVNGVSVPAHLIERSQRARERLAA